jgi:hypothetical protein
MTQKLDLRELIADELAGPDALAQELARVFPETAQQLEADGSPVPWLPLPKEPPLDYICFQWWRDAGPTRPRLRDRDRRAAKWNWSVRAAMYDEWTSTHPQDTLTTAEDMRKGHLASIRIGGHLIKTELAKYAVQSDSSSQPIVSLESLVGMLEKLVKLERLLNGESTDNISVRGAVDLTNLSDEQLASLAEMSEKASAPKVIE